MFNKDASLRNLPRGPARISAIHKSPLPKHAHLCDGPVFERLSRCLRTSAQMEVTASDNYKNDS